MDSSTTLCSSQSSSPSPQPPPRERSPPPPPQNQTQWGRLCSPRHRVVGIVKNAPHPNQRAQDRCCLEWIHREALWRCRRREDSVRHFIAWTKIWCPTRKLWDHKIHKIAGAKTSIKFANDKNKKACVIFHLTNGAHGKPVCKNAFRTRFYNGKPCAKHTCNQKLINHLTFEQKIPISRGYSLMLSQFT
jgi:hypothetical protein